jgi:iron complex transport system substrate-binding protein
MLKRPPQRIVSAYLAVDEILAELVDPARVVGVSAYADDPATSNCRGVYAPAIPRTRAEPEGVVALEPDLVFITGYTRAESVHILERAGIPLVRFGRFDSFAEVLTNVALVGAAVGEDQGAARMIADAQRRIDAVTRRAEGLPRPRVLYYDAPGFTAGAGTLIGEMIERAGGRNAMAEVGMRGAGKVGMETLLALEADVILLPTYGENADAVAALRQSELWKQLPAVRRGRVHAVSAAWMTSVSHHTVRGLELVAALLHPEIFRHLDTSDPTRVNEARSR